MNGLDNIDNDNSLSNVSNGAMVDGNTNSSTKRGSLKKRWCLTLNNWSIKEYDNLIIDLINDNVSNKFIIGKEVGDNGTPHLQIYINFYKKVRFTYIKKFNSRFHIEPARANELDNIKYCSKDNDYYTYNLNVPEPLIIIDKSKLYKWQLLILDIIDKPIDNRCIYWFFDNNGKTGKSTFSKYLVINHNAIILSGKSNDMKNCILEYFKTNSTHPKLIIINLPRSFNDDYLSYPGIEDIKDMLFYSGKYEGGMICGNSPNIFIFSNKLPDINQLSKDRWNIYDICNKYWFYKDGIERYHPDDEYVMDTNEVYGNSF